MDVLIATSDRQKGGIERALRDQLGLLECLSDISLSILSPAGTLTDLAQAKGYNHYPVLDAHRLMMRMTPMLSRAMLGSRQFDIILCHNGFMASALKRHTNRLIGICHNDKPRQFKACDELVCLTKGAYDKACLEGWDKSQLHIIPHYHEAVITKQALTHHHPMRIGCAGRMVAKKNLALFIDIASLVKRTHPEITFELAGDGELKEEITKLNKKKGEAVQLKGWVDFNHFLQTIDVLVIPSLDEPFGFVFIEAMSQGVGILASKTHGADFCLQSGEIAPLFESNDAQSFADEIIQLATSQSKLTALKKACLSRAHHEDFTKNTALQNWQKALYQNA